MKCEQKKYVKCYLWYTWENLLRWAFKHTSWMLSVKYLSGSADFKMTSSPIDSGSSFPSFLEVQLLCVFCDAGKRLHWDAYRAFTKLPFFFSLKFIRM